MESADWFSWIRLVSFVVGGLFCLRALDILLTGYLVERMFDHWAHLGGAAFGVAYYAYGPSFWKNLRRTFTPPADQ